MDYVNYMYYNFYRICRICSIGVRMVFNRDGKDDTGGAIVIKEYRVWVVYEDDNGIEKCIMNIKDTSYINAFATGINKFINENINKWIKVYSVEVDRVDDK